MFANVQIINTANHDFTSSNYYCYVLKDPDNNEPFYVGKGKRDRLVMHKYDYFHGTNNYKRNKINKILSTHGYYLAEVIFTSCDESAALQREVEMIAELGRNVLVNATNGGENPPQHAKTPIDQYNLYGEYIHTFNSYIEAAQSLDGSRVTEGMILECCRGAIATAREYYWTYSGELIKRPRTKILPVEQYYANGQYFTRYYSASDAAKTLNSYSSEIKRAIISEKLFKGFRWKYVDVLANQHYHLTDEKTNSHSKTSKSPRRTSKVPY